MTVVSAIGRRFAQRANQCVNAVIAGEGREAEVGHDEPLRGALVTVVLRFLRRLCDDDVDARLELAGCVGYGDGGRHLLVELRGDVHLALIDLDARAIADRVDVIARELPLQVARLKRRREIAVADAINFDVDLACVGRDDRNALLATRGENVSLAGEAHERRSIRHIDGDIGRFG